MNSNKPNNIYDLASERKRLKNLRKQQQGASKAGKAKGGAVKQKAALFGQVLVFLIMVGVLMYQCGGH